MDERGLALLRQLISEVEGAPYPGVVDLELYTIWFEHVQSVAQEALEYLSTADPERQREEDEAALAGLDV
ncbi:MAG TPA: hypothetical protein VMC79_11730 [Rectinemataceae bacterium]|nr:hypothetical protein [Rectinemataceae bacterium]